MAVDYGKLGELIDGYGGIAVDDLNALQEVRDPRDDEITRLRDENCRLREALAEKDMLHAKGVNWNDFPAMFKRGTYVQRSTVSVPFRADDLDRLPPKHSARTNSSLIVERSVCRVLDMPPFGTVTNREAVIFDGAAPLVADGPNYRGLGRR